jgi:hypothetical protein
VPTAYLTLTGAVWGGVALAAGSGLWRGAVWAPGLARWGSLAFGLWYWADRLFLVGTDYERTTRPWGLAVTVIVLLGLHAGLALPKSRHYFQETGA